MSIRVRYLSANDAWCVVVGGTEILTLDRFQRGKRLFHTREELVEALDICGLGVRDNGTVYSVEA
jgi:hypothetical protein